MGKKWKGFLPSLIRTGYVAFMILLQVAFMIGLAWQLRVHILYLYFLLEFISLAVVVFLINKDTAAAHRIGWILVIVCLPVTGLIMYLQWGSQIAYGKVNQQHKWIVKRGQNVQQPYNRKDTAAFMLNPSQRRLMDYLSANGFAVYKDTQVRYFSLGELGFEEVMKDLRKAKRFIFMEFFIIAQGNLWEKIHSILLEKVKEGVEVRLLYDDWGTLTTLPARYHEKLQEEGIKTRVFNPLQKYLSKLYLNYRNHQKIIVIDGVIGYTGGTNLADEYINLYQKHGHWKDQMIRLKGQGTLGLTVCFLTMWQIVRKDVEECYEKYLPKTEVVGRHYCQPYMDGPCNNPNCIAKDVYLQMIHLAGERLYVTTPYLVVESEVLSALKRAAKSGVDVRMILPKIPDHKRVQQLSRYYYGELMQAGVRIFEYTPGFIHAKMMMNEFAASVGTINMDYRSFYLHYECGVILYEKEILKEIEEDFLNTQEKSEEICLVDWRKRPIAERVEQQFMRLFAGLV